MHDDGQGAQVTVSRDEANDLFHALIRMQKLLLAARQAAPRVHPGVDAVAYPVMFTVARHGPVGISDIADALHSDVSTVSRQVSALVSAGLLAKEPDPRDGRATLVSLTDEGHDALELALTARGTWFQGLLADWHPSEAQLLTDHLLRLGDVLDTNLRARRATTPSALPLQTRPSKETPHG